MRTNQLGHLLVPDSMRSSLGFGAKTAWPSEMVQYWQADLEYHGFQFPLKPSPKVFTEHFPLPQVPEANLAKHFDTMAKELLGSQFEDLQNLADFEVPDLDQAIPVDLNLETPGWTLYPFDGSPSKSVQYPLGKAVVFDTETYVKQGAFPIIAVALDEHGIYLWLAPELTSNTDTYTPRLVPVGTGKTYVGHNVSYDRIRAEEEYNLQRTNFWLDTLSMNMTLHGIAGGQRWFHAKKKAKDGSFSFDPSWANAGTTNSLVAAYNFNCYEAQKWLNPDTPKLEDSDKDIRNVFVDAENLSEFRDQLYDLCRYALRDAWFTTKLFQVLWPKMLRNSESVVPLAGIIFLNTNILPLVEDWQEWFDHVESVYNQYSDRAQQALQRLADLTLEANIQDDPWTSQLDWSCTSRGKYKGIPKWYKETQQTDLTVKKRTSHLLLKLEWEGSPVVFLKDMGWCYQKDGEYFRIPHKDGDGLNVGTLLNNDFANFLEDGTLSSSLKEAKELLEIAIALSYWTSVRSRVSSQIVRPAANPYGKPANMVVPCLVPRGTITGRTVETLWNTVCSTKPNKIGSELKARIQAPDRWKFVHADFTGQEMTIASLFSDAYLNQMVGSSALSMMVMVGDKTDKTDVHSMLSKKVNISREDAKTCGFAMLYGAGAKGVAKVLKAANRKMSEKDCLNLAKKMLEAKKGIRSRDGYYHEGTDSNAYNFMLKIAQSANPTLPLFGTKITSSLKPSVVDNEFITARTNWTIQGSGGEMLAGFIVAVEWLFQKFNLRARFIWSLYDEMLSMAHEDDAMAAAYCYQIAHIWLWALFRQKLGQEDMPAGAAYFPDITVGKVYRKEANQSTKSPSHPVSEPDDVSLGVPEIFAWANQNFHKLSDFWPVS